MIQSMKRFATFLMCAVLMAVQMPKVLAASPSEGKTVRVGWYESSYNHMDENGRRSGYAYEYQMKIASYNGWKYEYIIGSWSELLEKLMNGEIDLMSDVSYTAERAEKILYPSISMGTEDYYLFTAPGNQDISSDDYSTLNGKRIGINKGSIQYSLFIEWAEKNSIRADIIEQTCSEAESLKMIETGKLDGYVTVDSFTDPKKAVPVCMVGSSDFYFAVNGQRKDLLAELENALNRIYEENRYYNQELFDKYIVTAGANAFLTGKETEWVKKHGVIRVGYQDKYLAFCAKDPDTGELTGALKEFLAFAADSMVNAHLTFEASAFATAGEAMEALQRGEIDCVFPANLSSWDGENMGLFMTPSLMRTDVYAVIRQSDRKFFENRDRVIAAVNMGNINYESFLTDNYPDWKTVFYPDTDECLKAVSRGVADCVLISSYRYNNISRLCKKYRLTTVSAGTMLDYSFAVKSGNAELYSILSKVTAQVPDATVNASLLKYVTEDAKLTLEDFITDHLAVVMIVTGIILSLILVLLIRSMRAGRKAARLISATETDGLTGLYSRNYFLEYANRMYNEKPDAPMDAAVMNIEQFHSVNALNGREYGDHILRELGKEIQAAAKENGGIAGRFEADSFDIYCHHREEWKTVYDRLQGTLDNLSLNVRIRLRMGVMPWQAHVEPVQMFDGARTACSMARRNYMEHLILFDEGIHEREKYEQRLMNDLHRALEHYEFEVYYQPQYDIRGDAPKLVGAEALIRWNHHELGLIAPNEFIPLLEKNGNISEVDRYVWSETVRQIVKWKEMYGIELPVSVNLSRVDVFDPKLDVFLDNLLAYQRLGREMLKLEVTESAYTENAGQVIQVVEGLRKKGYEVEMDDFGSGYSSLNMLSLMPVDVLKMDRAFIRNIENNEKDEQLVALILGIAKSLKIPVVAEGVEKATQLKKLKELGCEMVQGYYFSKPLPVSEFEKTILQKIRE